MIARIVYTAIVLVVLGALPRDAFHGGNAAASADASALAVARPAASIAPANCPPAR
jgi:uncharacterized protein (DUF924 family)